MRALSIYNATIMSDIKEYKINVPQEKIEWLKRKLDDYTWPEELEDGGWDYGAPRHVMRLNSDDT
jgi:hypothetical protein